MPNIRPQIPAAAFLLFRRARSRGTSLRQSSIAAHNVPIFPRGFPRNFRPAFATAFEDLG